MFAVIAVGFSCGPTSSGTNTTTGTETTSTGTETGTSADIKATLTEVYVDANNQSATKDGKTWDTAFADVNSAVDALVAEGGDIYIAVGTYNPEIILKDRVNIRFYGGYQKGDDTSTSVMRGFSTFDGQNRAKILVSILGKSEGILFDGFIFQNVKDRSAVEINATVDGTKSFKPENVTIDNCMFQDNENFAKAEDDSNGFGGGLVISDAQKIVVSNSRFTGNKANSAGGAIYVRESTVTIEETAFDKNESGEQGGAIYLDLSLSDKKATLTNLTFTKNISKIDNGGGAIFAIFDVDIAQKQLVFSGKLTHSENKSENNSGNFLAISFGKEDDGDTEIEIAVEQSELAEFITVGTSGLKLENSADVYFPVAEPVTEDEASDVDEEGDKKEAQE